MSSSEGSTPIPGAGAPLSPQELRAEQARSLDLQASQILAELKQDAASSPPKGFVTPPGIANTDRWRAYKNYTGAFDSAAASFRLMPRGYYWREIAWSMLLLYGVFVGLPASAGAWAAWQVGLKVGWW